jgi:hydrogenase maturation protease
VHLVLHAFLEVAHRAGGALSTRVIACGQSAAGDDGVAFHVLDALHAEGLPRGVELCRAADATSLLSLLEGAGRVVIVDAALGLAPGSVEVLAPSDFELAAVSHLSSHGLGVRQAIELAQLLAPELVCRDIRVVAIGILQPRTLDLRLSPEATAAIPRAASAVRRCLESDLG